MMSKDIYFYDQYKRVSHIGGIQRFKRHPDELNQALHHVRVAQAADSEQAGKLNPVTPATTLSSTPPPVRQQQVPKNANEVLLRKIQRKFHSNFVPELLFKDLDKFFQRLEDNDLSRITSTTTTTKPASSRLAKSEHLIEEIREQDENVRVEEVDDEHELIAKALRQPRISLPASLILQLHATWPDLIEDVRYKYPVWRTRGGEEEWNRLVEKRRIEKLNAEKHRNQLNSKQGMNFRNSSRASVSSIKNLTALRRTTTTTGIMSQVRTQRSTSRVSFTGIDTARLLKSLPLNSAESFNDIPKGGLHFEFKFSTQTDPIRRQQQEFIQPKGVIIDTKSIHQETLEDQLMAIQKRCKELLSEMKEKIMSEEKNVFPDRTRLKLMKLWFYGDNQQIRTRTNLMTHNETAKRQRSKFTFAIVKQEIPERYQIEIEIPTSKRKCLLEFNDGSGQIYYPSGRLAVLRLRSEKSQILFFDDVEGPEKSFLGYIISDFGGTLMQPPSYPRLVNCDQFEHVYLCSGRTGCIEKEVQWHRKPIGRESAQSYVSEPLSVEDDILPPLFENTIQFQINPSMQLEISHTKQIRFAFAHDQEEFRYQFTVQTTPSSVAPSVLKKTSSKSKYPSTSTTSNETSIRQQVQIERLLDGQVNQKELPAFKDLLAIKKRIRVICGLWLKACRTTLGVLDIESYLLPDLPSSDRRHLVSAIKSTGKISKANRSKSAKPRHVTISSRNEIREFPQNSEKESLLRTSSAKPVPDDFFDAALRPLKERMAKRRNLSPINFSSIVSSRLDTYRQDGKRSIRNDSDMAFVCPTMIRHRLIKDGRSSTTVESCSCRMDRLPIIHDLELDAFIAKTNKLNSKQLILIGIINSNLHQFEPEVDNGLENHADKSREILNILQNFHNERQHGRSPMSLCRLSTSDEYRCVIYDLAEATKQSPLAGPLLVRRHHVQPGFLLIYQSGQLIFGDSIFNGYGRNLSDLEKQLKSIQKPQIPLPDQFKFISDNRPVNKTTLKSV